MEGEDGRRAEVSRLSAVTVRSERSCGFILKPQSTQVTPTGQDLSDTGTDKLLGSGARLSRSVPSAPEWLPRARLSLLHGAYPNLASPATCLDPSH